MKGISLFANVGIAETYTAENNLEIIVANELLENRSRFYSEMYPSCNMVNGDITNREIYNEVLSSAKEQNCDFLIATPPCQGMSVAGQMKEDDPRNSLIKFVVKMIQDLYPKYAIIENVAGILKTYISLYGNSVKIVDYIREELEPLGYIINSEVIDAADHGTPQNRKRAIFLISRVGKWEFPEEQDQTTVNQAISHLPSLESGQSSSDDQYHSAKTHNERHILCMSNTPSGKTAHDNAVFFPRKENGVRAKGFKTTYKRISWDKPAPTITMANGSISSQNNVHPGRLQADGTYSDARVLTLREIFILTGLPSNWTPPEWASENLIREVIGEGVPPKLIKALLSTVPK